MEVNLDKYDLICLIKGSTPNYNVMDKLSKYGYFNNSYGEWKWHIFNLDNLTKQELYKIYNLCKESWK